ncbi:MAG: BMP family ABC transporter substrate-binding protein [Nitrososphaerota archaeon]|nr:BMP family ABC transporter substrate-binding protein [Nitrososphaerota archaeon]
MCAEKISRREFLGVARGAAIGGIVAAGALGAIAGYLGGSAAAPAKTTTVTSTVTSKVTSTVTAAAKPLKVGYVYVGPVGDYGWSYGHDRGRRWADERFGAGVESFYIESVPEAEVGAAIESLVARGANLIFTTSFGYMDATAEYAEKYPDVYFVHISGYRSGAAGNAPENMSAAFAEFYQLYFLNGLAAGAVTETGVIGYVGAYPIPEVVRHINAFVLGANYSYKKKTGKNIKAHVNWIFSWVAPDKARSAAVALVEEKNCDVLAFTEDTPAVLQVAEEYQKKGKRVWGFSHYSDMREYGPTAHLTGQIANWGPIYLEFYKMVATNSWVSMDIWTRIGDYMPYRWRKKVGESTAGQPEGTVFLAPLNPVIPNEWQLEIKRLYEDMKELLFEPFSVDGNLGEPIRDQDGEVRIKAGERADHDMLWNMDWLVEYIEEPLPR